MPLKSKTDLRARTAEKMRERGDFSGQSIKRKGRPKGVEAVADSPAKAPSGKGRPKTEQAKRRAAVVAKDRAWAGFVKERAEGLCQVCFAPGDDAHHLYPKGSPSYRHLRHDPANGLFVCRAHHAEAHRDMAAFRKRAAYDLTLTFTALYEATGEIKGAAPSPSTEVKG